MEFGGGHTGWSCAWLINLYARLQNGDKAEEYIDYLLNKLTAPNMFDLHPPLERISGIPWVFQIDGNFGACAGICEMLLQSHAGYADILAALPDEWQDGSFDGLVARGNFVVGATWRGGIVTEIRVHSRVGGKLMLHAKGLSGAKSEKPFSALEDDMVSIETLAGESFLIEIPK